MSGFELGPIRPPSESSSLPIRVTRNCPWNRCKFCNFFKGRKFELRTIEEIEQDIVFARQLRDRFAEVPGGPGYGDRLRRFADSALGDVPRFPVYNIAYWLYGGGRHAFLQDANALILPVGDLIAIIRLLKSVLPEIDRITTYGSSKIACRRSVDELARLHEAGLSRIHVGIESGYDPLLAFMDKGATSADHVKAGLNIVASGISLSVYVLLGLGGETMSGKHAAETARVINEIDPDFIRLRTMVITPDMLLQKEVRSGNFVPLSDEQTVREEQLFLDSLECHSTVVSDSMTNLLPEVEGRLPGDKGLLLEVIDRFLALSPPEREVYKMGRRLGCYRSLDDLNDADRSEAIERLLAAPDENGAAPAERSAGALARRFTQWRSLA